MARQERKKLAPSSAREEAHRRGGGRAVLVAKCCGRGVAWRACVKCRDKVRISNQHSRGGDELREIIKSAESRLEAILPLNIAGVPTGNCACGERRPARALKAAHAEVYAWADDSAEAVHREDSRR